MHIRKYTSILIRSPFLAFPLLVSYIAPSQDFLDLEISKKELMPVNLDVKWTRKKDACS